MKTAVPHRHRDRHGTYYSRVKAWTVATLRWAKQQWPDQIGSIVPHSDHETTPQLRTYRAKLSAWRAGARDHREQEAKAWETMRAAASMAPIERTKSNRRVSAPVPPLPTPQPRTRPRMG